MANSKALIAAMLLCLSLFVRSQGDADSVAPSSLPQQEQEIQMLRTKVASLGQSSNMYVLVLILLVRLVKIIAKN